MEFANPRASRRTKMLIWERVLGYLNSSTISAGLMLFSQ